MHPSFEQFVSALQEPEQRAAIRLAISDSDAAALLTRDDWIREYYAQWIALFPAENPASAATAGTATATAASVGGLSTGARVLLIVLVAACLGVATAALILPTLTGAGRADLAASPSSATPTAAPTDADGLTAVQAEFLNAELAISDTSVTQLVAGGMTLPQLHDTADVLTGIADVECTAVAKTPAGFETPGAKDKFIAGLTQGITLLGKTVTPTAAQAERVWSATVAYCGAK